MGPLLDAETEVDHMLEADEMHKAYNRDLVKTQTSSRRDSAWSLEHFV